MSSKIILPLIVYFSCIVFVNSSFGQNYSKDKCLGLALKLENEIGLLSPTDEINN